MTKLTDEMNAQSEISGDCGGYSPVPTKNRLLREGVIEIERRGKLLAHARNGGDVQDCEACRQWFYLDETHSMDEGGWICKGCAGSAGSGSERIPDEIHCAVCNEDMAVETDWATECGRDDCPHFKRSLKDTLDKSP